ncbi:MAG: hypothetical protein ACRESE_07220 [Gammaproteobacteria bacterium]
MAQSQTLLTCVRDAGFLPVRVDGGARWHECEGKLVLGTLEGYLGALKSLGVKFILVFAEVFAESDFVAEDLSDIELLEEKYLTTDENVDLTAFVSAIKDFRKHIGEECLYRLSALVDNLELEYCIEPD